MTRAMILEGDSTFGEILKEILHARFPGVEFLVEADGIGAMEKIESLHPDLILIDIKITGANALDLIRKIKTKHPESTVIFLCSYDMPEYREMASRHGADHFIQKDSSIENYLRLIGSILSSGSLPGKKANGYPRNK